METLKINVDMLAKDLNYKFTSRTKESKIHYLNKEVYLIEDLTYMEKLKQYELNAMILLDNVPNSNIKVEDFKEIFEEIPNEEYIELHCKQDLKDLGNVCRLSYRCYAQSKGVEYDVNLTTDELIRIAISKNIKHLIVGKEYLLSINSEEGEDVTETAEITFEIISLD